jgi:hypothetical protein
MWLNLLCDVGAQRSAWQQRAQLVEVETQAVLPRGESDRQDSEAPRSGPWNARPMPMPRESRQGYARVPRGTEASLSGKKNGSKISLAASGTLVAWPRLQDKPSHCQQYHCTSLFRRCKSCSQRDGREVIAERRGVAIEGLPVVLFRDRLFMPGSTALPRPLRHSRDGRAQLGIRRGRVFEQVQHHEAIALRQDDTFRFLDHSLGLPQSGLQDKVRQVCVPQRRRAHERGLLLRPQPEVHSLGVVHSRSGHRLSPCTY